MKITIITVGKIKNSPEHDLINEFLKKIPYKIEIKEIDLKNSSDPLQLMRLEAAAISAEIPKNTQLIILDPKGAEYSSKEFTDYLFKFPNITFIIGGAFGIDRSLFTNADFVLSLGKMTWPHKLARVMLVEQIYRSHAIRHNHPYNK